MAKTRAPEIGVDKVGARFLGAVALSITNFAEGGGGGQALNANMMQVACMAAIAA